MFILYCNEATSKSQYQQKKKKDREVSFHTHMTVEYLTQCIVTFRCQVRKRWWTLPHHSSRGAGWRGQWWWARLRRVLQRRGVSWRRHHAHKGQVPQQQLSVWLDLRKDGKQNCLTHLFVLFCLFFFNDTLDHFNKKKFSWRCKVFIFLFHRLSNKNQCDAEGDFDPEVSRSDHQPESYYDDDQQLIYQDSRRSPRRWFLPSPQGEIPQYNNTNVFFFLLVDFPGSEIPWHCQI